MFNSREELDDALLGFVEPSEQQIRDVDRALAKEGILLTPKTVESNIKRAFVQNETIGSPFYREPGDNQI